MAIVLIVAVGQGLWSATRSGDNEDHSQHQFQGLPASIAGLKLLSQTTGPDAIQSVDVLHGLDVELADARIGEYEKHGMVWVGVARSDAQAATLVDRMTQAISRGDPSFVHIGETDIDGMTVHEVRGSQGLNVYYQMNREVIWVASPPGSNNQFVMQAVQQVP